MLGLFKIDDRKIKEIIKNAVGAKEGDFNGQSMKCGTTVNPVVVINGNKLDYVDRSITFEQNEVWYPFGVTDTSLKSIHSIVMKQTNTETNDKNVKIDCENMDGKTFSSAVTAISNNASFYAHLFLQYTANEHIQIDTGTTLGFSALTGGDPAFPVKNLRFTFGSAKGTAQTFVCRIWYKE